MNTIKVKISFKKGICEVSGIKLITYDYASTVIKFQFDDNSGSNLFTLLDPQNNIVYSDIIENNEVLLYKMIPVTTDHDNKIYQKYLDSNENIFWYQAEDEKLYDSEWIEIESFDLDNYDIVEKRGSLFTVKGSYKFEVSKYVNDSKLTSVSGKIGVKNNLVSIDSYVTPYLSIFDTLMGEVDNLDIDVSKSGTVTTIIITKKDGSTETVYVNDGETGPQGIQGEIGPQGEPGYTPVKGVDYFDGAPGAKGDDGFSPIANVTKVGKTATITITDKTGTTTESISDGEGGGDVHSSLDPIYSREYINSNVESLNSFNITQEGQTLPLDGILMTILSMTESELRENISGICQALGAFRIPESALKTIQWDERTAIDTNIFFSSVWGTLNVMLGETSSGSKVYAIHTIIGRNFHNFDGLFAIGGIISGTPELEIGYENENTNNKVTSLSSSSTDDQYPSAKAVYDFVMSIINGN